MTTPIAQIPKPEAGQYKDDRKLFLVPVMAVPPDAPEDGRQLAERYWSEVRDQVEGLERSLGKVTHVFHETLYLDGEEGMALLQELNPQGCSFIRAMCHSEARLEATEDRAILEESSDWQRCLSIGLMSDTVRSMALEGYRQATSRRYEHIAGRIDTQLQGSETGVLFIREDHGVQFPSDVQVFYVAPPALDAMKRWIGDFIRSAAQAPAPPPEQADEQPPSPESPEAGETPAS